MTKFHPMNKNHSSQLLNGKVLCRVVSIVRLENFNLQFALADATS